MYRLSMHYACYVMLGDEEVGCNWVAVGSKKQLNFYDSPRALRKV